MRDELKDIRQLYFLNGKLNEALERAYEMGRVDGVLQYLEKKVEMEDRNDDSAKEDMKVE
jgi:hypothetical protein